ncbi:hypothetical protein HK101_002069 [Irineochytrium annulatum]|nr:hypothetical protein HK101_002069 [Irineochytrium annulatum]
MKLDFLARVGVLAGVALWPMAAPVVALDPTDFVTHRGTNDRSGYIPNSNLSPQAVSSSLFTSMFTTNGNPGLLLPSVNGIPASETYASPLTYTYPGTTQQVVVLATQTSNVYIIDASSGAILASTNLGPRFVITNERTGTPYPVYVCGDLTPDVGVTGTPVIDPTTSTVYMWAKTYINGGTGPTNTRYRLHALDLHTLEERAHFPVDVEGIMPDNVHDVGTVPDNAQDASVTFQAYYQLQRPALLLLDGVVYAGFGGHCDIGPYQGWIIGVDAAAGGVVNSWVTESGPHRVGGGGIWMSGAGLASDQSGRFFVATGNGLSVNLQGPLAYNSPPQLLGMASVEFSVNSSRKINPVNFFTPYDFSDLDKGDEDMGSGGISLFPSVGDFAGSTISVAGGKSNYVYVMNTNKLGGLATGGLGLDKVYMKMPTPGSMYSQATAYPYEGGWMYINPVGGPLKVYSFQPHNGQINFAEATTAPVNPLLGMSSPLVTSLNNAAGTAILWYLDSSGTLQAYNAVPSAAGTLTQIFSYQIPGTYPVNKFVSPSFGNGKVFVIARDTLYAFGAPTSFPLKSPDTNFGSVVTGTSSTLTVVLTAAATIQITSISITNPAFTLVNSPALPLSVSAGATVQLQVKFAPTAVGAAQGVLNIFTSGAVQPLPNQAFANLIGRALAPSALLTSTVSSVGFGAVITGSTAISQSILIANQGATALTISSVSTIASPFSVSGAPTIGASLAAGANITIEITFLTAKDGTYSQNLIISSSGGTLNIPVTGSSAGPPVFVVQVQAVGGGLTTGTAMNFGSVLQGNALSLNLVISNTGASALKFTKSKPPVVGQILPNVTITEASTLAAGAQITIPMIFTAPAAQVATQPQPYLAQWVFNTNDPASTGATVVTFTAQGVPYALPASVATWSYIGCYTDPGNPSILPFPELTTQSATMTVEACMTKCASLGAGYAGLQNNACSCGRLPPPSSLVQLETSCMTPCTGNSREFCGGPAGFIAVFSNGATGANSYKLPAGWAPTAGTGCLLDNVNSARSFPVGNDGTYTIEACLAKAAAGGYPLAGMEFGGECWLAIGFSNATSLEAPAGSCSMACTQANGQAELCGGPNLLTAFALNGFVAPPVTTTSAIWTATATSTAPPTSTTAPGSWASLGCFVDSGAPRALTQLLGDPKSVEACKALAIAGGYTFFGLEFGGECWADNALNKATSPAAPSTDCNMACSQNALETCGGPSRISVYSLNATPASTTASTGAASTTAMATTIATATTSTTTSAVAAPTLPPHWASIGCLIDSGAPRTLSQLLGNPETVETCQALAVAGGYIIFGLEYGGECWADTAFRNTTATLAPSADCNMPCNKNTLETCGAGSRLSVYALTSSPVTSSTASASTVVTSVQTVPTSSTTTITSVAGTSSSIGTSTTVIGSTVATASTSSSSTTTTMSSTSQSAPSTTTSTTAAATQSAAASWASIGCFIDSGAPRTLSQLLGNPVTVEACKALAIAGGYTMFGLEYGGECWADTAFRNTTVTVAPSMDCNMPCTQNTLETCGAGSRLSLYAFTSAPAASTASTSTVAASTQASPATSSSTTTATTSAVPTSASTSASTATSITTTTLKTTSSSLATATATPGWTSLGCLYDGVKGNPRTFIKNIGSNLSVEGCQSLCLKSGYTLAGLEYGRECWCDVKFELPLASVQAPAADCNMLCNANKSEICGSGNRLSAYQYIS